MGRKSTQAVLYLFLFALVVGLQHLSGSLCVLVDQSRVALALVSPLDERISRHDDSQPISGMQPRHWCLIAKNESHPNARRFFDHFPHAAEEILPCWSWFRRTNATSNCGIILLDSHSFSPKDGNPSLGMNWQQQLVDAIKCEVREYQFQTISKPPVSRSTVLSSEEDQTAVIHQIPLVWKRPRPTMIRYLEFSQDAHALRRLFVSDEYIASVKGPGKPLRIGMIQRRNESKQGRHITNFRAMVRLARKRFPQADIEVTEFNFLNLTDQATWFATKDAIIAAHGAALTNSVFITHGTIIIQLYPLNFFVQSLEPLVEQSGGIALNWYPAYKSDNGKGKGWRHRSELLPVVDTHLTLLEGPDQMRKARSSDIFVREHEVLDLLKKALASRIDT